MIEFKKYAQSNKYTFFSLFVLWFIAFFYIVLHEKGSLVLFFDERRTPYFTVLFRFLTFLGEHWVCIFFCVLMLIINLKKGIFLSSILIFNTLLVQGLKIFVFPNHHRPYYFFKDQLHLIDGIEMHSNQSFPSGHTMAGFTLFFCLSLFIENKVLKIGLVSMGVLVGLSRVYLAQHFLVDITAASVLATISTSAGYLIYSKKIKSNENRNS